MSEVRKVEAGGGLREEEECAGLESAENPRRTRLWILMMMLDVQGKDYTRQLVCFL